MRRPVMAPRGDGGAERDPQRVTAQRHAAVHGECRGPSASGNSKQHQVACDNAAEHLAERQEARGIDHARRECEKHDERVPDRDVPVLHGACP